MNDFESYRPMMFGIAYRMLGSVMEAEDMVQEAFLRYQATPKDSIRSLKSFLCTVTTRLCLDQLKSARAQRESYIGPWLPEPVLTDTNPQAASPLNKLTDYESISMAFLTLLENLTPVERAVFLLREVFDYEYAEIAEMVDKEEAACRQSFSRAKKHLAENRPRFKSSPEAHAKMLGRFMEACAAGDLEGLMSLLAEDVTAWTDGGGKVPAAARYPILGRDKVARGIIGILSRAPEGTTVEVIEANGLAALLIRVQGQIFSVLTLEVEGDFIRAVRNVANPDKLAHLNLPPSSSQEWRIRS
jgi:RNA polymerase sigma-70 factor (ECF subfamily)